MEGQEKLGEDGLHSR